MGIHKWEPDIFIGWPFISSLCTYFIPESFVTVSEQTSQPVVFDNVIVVIVVEGSGGRHTLGEVVMAAVQDTTAAAATTHTPSPG